MSEQNRDDNEGMESFDLPFAVTPLSDWGVLKIHGSDAADFLHKQLTQDILSLDLRAATFAAYCNAKGRMIASFVVCRWAADQYLLCCPESLVPIVQKKLQMFVLRSAVKIVDASKEFNLVGYSVSSKPLDARLDQPNVWQMVDAQASTWSTTHTADSVYIQLPHDKRHFNVLQIADASSTSASLTNVGDTTQDRSVWDASRVLSGVVPIYAATSEKFIPQMLNYEQIGGVNFKKGCYPGQEIVARSQYLGKLKRRGALFICSSSVAVGDELFHSDDHDQPCGLIADVAPNHGSGFVLLAEVKLESLSQGTIYPAGQPNSHLTALPLPYSFVDI